MGKSYARHPGREAREGTWSERPKALRMAEQRIRERAEDPKGYRRRLLEGCLRNYGLTLADWDAMMERQKGLCALCFRPQPVKMSRLFVDHDHKTGRVRGLLCHACNIGLAGFERALSRVGETPDVVARRFVDYLS